MRIIKHTGAGYNGAPGGEFIRVRAGETVELPSSVCDYLLETFPREWETVGQEQDAAPSHTKPEPPTGKRPAKPRKQR